MVSTDTVRDNKTSEKEERTSHFERPVTLTKQLLIESGAHFGHKTKDWHPKAFPYLYGIYNDIHVINLSHTLKTWSKIREQIVEMSRQGLNILFVGTKKQATDVIKREAENCSMPYVDKKWKGGTLTNFPTMRTRIDRLQEIESILSDESKSRLFVKKELGRMEKERKKLEDSLGGLRNMKGLPDLLFVVDANREHIAVREARSLGIPVMGILDSNCNPSQLDYVIPANDDAYKAVDLIVSAVADAINEGRNLAQQQQEIEEESAESQES